MWYRVAVHTVEGTIMMEIEADSAGHAKIIVLDACKDLVEGGDNDYVSVEPLE